MENSMEDSKKTKSQNYHMTQQFHSWVHIQNKKQKTPDFKRYMNPNIHNSIIYNCQDMEET